MKNVIKNNLLGFILGAILFSGITAYATSYLAKDISFTPKNTDWKKEDGSNITNVEEAINELYTKKEEDSSMEPLDYKLNGVILGSNAGRMEYDAFELNNLKNYKKMKLTFGESIGTWIDAQVYIDNQLVTTISDSNEHEIDLNNNSILKVKYVAKSGLGIAGINLHLILE